MNENQNGIAELWKAFLSQQETLTKLERRVTALEMTQTKNIPARFPAYDEELGKMQKAIDLLKLQVKNLASGCP